MKKFSFILAISMLAFVLAACGSGDSQGSGEEPTETVTVEHELGTTEVPKNPENVVVFDFGILDTLDQLGIPVSGVVQSSTIPSYLEEEYSSDEYTNIGALKEPDFEAIANEDPDLIIISGRQSSVYDQLSEIAPTIHLATDNQNYMESFKENMNVIGQIFDKQDEIDQALTAIDEQIAEVQDKAESLGLNAMILLANGDSISAYGQGSRFGIIHDVLGVPATDQNIDSATHGMSVSFEYVMQNNPDILYVIDRAAVISSGESQSTAQQLIENELVEGTNAAQNDNIFYLDPSTWYLSGGGLQSVSQMVSSINDSLDQAAANTEGAEQGSGSEESQSGAESESEENSSEGSEESAGSESSEESGSEQ